MLAQAKKEAEVRRIQLEAEEAAKKAEQVKLAAEARAKEHAKKAEEAKRIAEIKAVEKARADEQVRLLDAAKAQVARQAKGGASGQTGANQLKQGGKTSEQALIERSVREWALDWSGKYIEEYIDCYVPGYKQDGMSHDAWKKLRIERISKPKVIEITLRNMQIVVQDEHHATVTFEQSYRSDNYRDQAVKTLRMLKQSDHWLIAGESAGKTGGATAKGVGSSKSKNALR